MSDGERAEVHLGATGTDEAIRAAEDVRGAYVRAAGGISDAWQGLGGKITSAVGGAVRSVGSSVSTLAQDSIRLATALGNVSLASAVGQARTLDETLGRMATGRGVQLAELGEKLTKASKGILVGEPAIAAEARGISTLTGDLRGALDAMEGLGEEAIATGRSAEEMAPLGVVLHNVLGVAGDTREELGKLRAQADAVGTVGGPEQLERQIESLGGTLSGFSAKTDDARNRLTAFVGVLGAGLSPNIAGKVQQAVLGQLQGRALEINRTLGRDILDENGDVTDPASVLRDLAKSMSRRGLHGRRALLGWRRYLGNQAGSRVYNALEGGELSEQAIAELAGVTPSNEAHDRAQQFPNSGAGRRLGVQLANERAMRGVAEPLLDAQTAWGQAFSGHPVESIIGANLASSVAMSVAKQVGSALSGAGGGGSVATATGTGTAAAGALAGTAEAAELAEGALLTAGSALTPFAVALAGATLQLSALADVGQDRDQMGADWRREHAGLIEGEEDFTPTGIRRRREERERKDVTDLVGFAKSRTEQNKELGASGFEDMVKAYDPQLYDRSKSDATLSAILKALETGSLDGTALAPEIGKAVAEAIKENPPVQVVSDDDHPTKQVNAVNGKGMSRSTAALFGGQAKRGHHGG